MVNGSDEGEGDCDEGEGDCGVATGDIKRPLGSR